jgi:signal transduction histidine kinase
MQMGVTIVAEATGDGARRVRPGAAIRARCSYAESAVLLLAAAAVALYATASSLGWLGRPFPGFFLMENAVVPTVSGHGWPEDKAALFHSRVVAIDGQPVRSSAEVYALASARPPGTNVTYTFEKQGAEFTRTIPTRRFTSGDYLEVYGILLLIAWMNVVTGAAVAFMKPESRQARAYVRLTFVGCLFSATAVFLHQSGFPFLTKVYLAAESFFPASFIHLALVFPVERALNDARRLWVAFPYALAAALTVAKLHGFDQTPPDLRAIHASYLFNSASFVFFFASLIYCYRCNHDPQVRLRIKALLPSVVACGILTALAFAENSLSGGAFPLQWGLLFVPLFYASLAYAIVKHDLFDVDRFVRRSFAYALLTFAVATAYALVVALPARLNPAFSEQRTIIGLAFVLLLAYVLDPLRRAAQHLVDRAFYRTRLSYQETIGGLSEALTTLLSLPEVAERATAVLTDAMQLEFAALLVCGEETRGARSWSRRAGAPLTETEAGPALEALARAAEASSAEGNPSLLCQSIENPDARRAAEQWLTEAKARLVLPLRVHGRAIGSLVLGAKRSGQAFGPDDIDILRTLAHTTAVAASNALAVRALEELSSGLEATVRQRTAELSRAYDELKEAEVQLVQSEKMASLGRLVAGVAHELNNPASFVHGGLSNLAEYLSRLLVILEAYEGLQATDREKAERLRELSESLRIDYVRQETPRMLRICAEGSERIKKIVDDLRIFARADRGERAPVDVVEGIESTLALLSERLRRAGVEVRREYDEMPPVEAEAGLLNQVWMNLIGNAIDALEGRDQRELRIRLRAGGDGRAAEPERPGAGWIEVEIADTGHGIEPADVGHIFEPFFTTKPVGRGTGLGLSTAYSAVKSHGGKIVVESTPGSGTTFRVRLPAGGSSIPAPDHF